MALAAAALQGPHSYVLPHTQEATHGEPVACLRPHNWAVYAESHESPQTVAAVWDYGLRWIVMQESICRPLVHWRSASAWYVARGVFVIAHEYRHSQQHGGNPPFSDADEVDANCWARKHVRAFARDLGIRRHLPAVQIEGCP